MTAYCGLCGREFPDADVGDLIWCDCVTGPANAIGRCPERHREGGR